MEADLRNITEKLTALARREQLLAAAVGAAGLVVTLAASWATVLVLVVGRTSRDGSIAAGLGLLAIGAAGALGWTIWRWRQSRDLLRQARRVEALIPALRGRLITVAERSDGPVGQESPALLALAARRAGEALRAAPPEVVHPARPAKVAGGSAAAAVLLLVAMGLLLPVGPLDALRMLRGEPAATGPAAEAAPQDPDRAVVGDIVLRYEYPDYTGLEPLEIPNSNGTARGVPGTRVTVRARTAEVFQAAELEVLAGEEAARAPAELVDGRDLEAAFTIGSPGSWRFRLTDPAGVLWLSPDYAIEVEQDLAPTVELQARFERLQVAWNEKIPLAWVARDDFGVQKVSVRINGEAEVLLREPLEPVSSLKGTLSKTPDELGLKPGDQATLEIQAWDSDAVSGSKAGRSRKIKLVVMGPKGQARRVFEFRRELRDALVDVLADFTLDPRPPARSQAALSRWGEAVAGRFDPLDDLVDTYWDTLHDGTLEGLIMEEIRRLGGGLLRFVQVVAVPGADTPVGEQDLATLSELRGDLVEQLETAVLMLDKMVRIQAMGALYQTGQEVARAAEALEAKVLGGAHPGEIQGRMGALDRMEPRLLAAAGDLAEGPLPALVERSVADADLLEARIRELLALPEAEADPEQVERLVRLLADVYRHLEAQLEHMQREAEEESDEMESRIQELIEELERLEASERELEQSTRAAREAHGGGTEELVALWDRAARLSRQLSERALGLSDEAGGGFFGSMMGETADQSARLRRAVDARDIDGARIEAYRARARVEQTLRQLELLRAMSAEDIPDAEPYYQARAEINELEVVLSELNDKLNRASPALRQAAVDLHSEQVALQAPTEAARTEAAAVARELPMGAPGLNESMDGAVREMARSARALEQARVVEAEGAERAAADRIRQAIEALSQAAQAMAQLQEAMQQPGQGSSEEGGGDEDEQQYQQDVEIPTPEEFRTPEEYRQALLEGMQADVPPEYKALKKRYYEELVRQ